VEGESVKSNKMAEDREAIRLQRERVDLQTIMGMETGRRLIWRLLTYCGVYKDIEGEGPNADRQIGMRRVGLYMLGEIGDASEENMFQMMKEAKVRAEAERFNIDLEDEEYKEENKLTGGHVTMIEDLV
jgi:hypothetical protein